MINRWCTDDEEERALAKGIKKSIKMLKNCSIPDEKVIRRLMKEYDLDLEDSKDYLKEYYDEIQVQSNELLKLFYNTLSRKDVFTMPLPQQHDYTIDDIYDLPEGTRAELIDGQIYYMAPPSRRHQKILFSISRTIADYIDRNNGLCEVNIAPFAVFLSEDDRNYVEPDISVVCDPTKLNDKGCTGAPDWIIEIVSPSSKQMDYFTKLFKYRTAGVREYWIVDPIKDWVLVYNFNDSTSEQYTFADTIKAGIYDDLYVDFSKIK